MALGVHYYIILTDDRVQAGWRADTYEEALALGESILKNSHEKLGRHRGFYIRKVYHYIPDNKGEDI